MVNTLLMMNIKIEMDRSSQNLGFIGEKMIFMFRVNEGVFQNERILVMVRDPQTATDPTDPPVRDFRYQTHATRLMSHEC